MDDKKILAEKFTRLQINLESLLKQREEIERRIDEIEETIDAIKEIKINSDAIFSVGTNTFGFCKIASEKFLVNVGANVGIEMDRESAIKILEKTKESLNKVIIEIDTRVNKIVGEQEKILAEIDKKPEGTE